MLLWSSLMDKNWTDSLLYIAVIKRMIVWCCWVKTLTKRSLLFLPLFLFLSLTTPHSFSVMNGDAITNSSTPSLSMTQPDTPKPATGKQPKHPTPASLDSGPVQAYAKLEGDGFCYYMRTLQVTMGRKVTKPDNVDIALGTLKSVSRHHARLFYNFTTQRFEFMVFGKNGAFVNEQFVEKGVTVALENR